MTIQVDAAQGVSEPLSRFAEVARELMSAHRELATLLAAEHEAKVTSWFEAQEDTLKARDRIADFNAMPLTLDIIKLKGEITALREEKDWLTILLCGKDAAW